MSTRFEGYPLCAVREGNRCVIYTHNAVKPHATVYATTDTDEKALAIVNKVNFHDELLEALQFIADEYCNGGMLDGTDAEKRIYAVLSKATGGQ